LCVIIAAITTTNSNVGIIYILGDFQCLQFLCVDRTTVGSSCVKYVHINHLQPTGHYMYHQFNTQQFYVLPTQCIYVFCVDVRTNSDYFPIQH